MKIDNFKEITQFIQTKNLNLNDFLFVQIIQRSKDNPSIKENKVIVTFNVKDSYELFNLKNEIIFLCESTNSRCYINVNRRNAKVIASVLSKKCIDIIGEKNRFIDFNREINSIIGSTHSEDRYSQKYIIDIDTLDESLIFKYEKFLLTTYKERKNKPNWIKVKTVNGFHLIANVFDYKLFYTYCDIEKIEKPKMFTDNCTLVYA